MQPVLTRRRAIMSLTAALAAGARLPAHAGGIDWQQAPLRLLMLRQNGCPDCAAWDRQIRPGYAASPTGRLAPLLEIEIDGPWPDGLVLGARPRFTPGFVLLDRGTEVARFEGYRNPALFHAHLAATLQGRAAS